MNKRPRSRARQNFNSLTSIMARLTGPRYYVDTLFIMISDDMSFDEWFDIFLDRAKKHHGYRGPIDKYTFEDDYEVKGMTPEASADEFVAEMNG